MGSKASRGGHLTHPPPNFFPPTNSNIYNNNGNTGNNEKNVTTNNAGAVGVVGHSSDSIPSTHTTNSSGGVSDNSLMMDEEMYAALINHANLNAPSYLPPSQRVVYAKIKNCILFEDIHNDEYIMERYSMCLSDPKAMLDTYLNLDNTITKQWDERVKLLEQEYEESNNNAISENDAVVPTPMNNEQRRVSNAKNLHLFSPQFYDLITSAKTEKTKERLEIDQDLEDVKQTLTFDGVGLSQLSLSTEGGNINAAFEDLIGGDSHNSTPQRNNDKLNPPISEKKEVKWSNDLVSDPTITPHKKHSLAMVSSPEFPNSTPLQDDRSQQLVVTPSSVPLTSTVLSSSISNQQPQYAIATPPIHSSNTPMSLTRSSAQTDIPKMNTSTNIGGNISTTSGMAISNSAEVQDSPSIGEEDSLREWWMNNPTLEKSIKIKLIVTDMHHHNKTKQTIRQIVSPLLSPSAILPVFGMFHTALVISEFKLEVSV